MSAVEMVSEGPSCQEAFQWLAAVRLRGRSHAALACGPAARITYEVMLPPQATVISWCSLSPEAWDRGVESIEFEIRVRTESAESSARCLVGQRGDPLAGRWRALRVTAPEAGPARIVLTTSRADHGANGDVCALWGDPRIETPRPAAELMSVLRSAVSRARRAWPVAQSLAGHQRLSVQAVGAGNAAVSGRIACSTRVVARPGARAQPDHLRGRPGGLARSSYGRERARSELHQLGMDSDRLEGLLPAVGEGPGAGVAR